MLLTIVKDGDAPEPKVIDLHKYSWGVKNDGSQRFKDTVVKWLNDNGARGFKGTQPWYYGIPNRERFSNLHSESKVFTHILTLDEFCALAYPETTNTNYLDKKYVRCYFDCIYNKYTANKWYQLNHVKGGTVFSVKDNKGIEDTFINVHHSFDLSVFLDYNPETLIGKYIGDAQIESIYYADGKPCFHMNKGAKDLPCSDINPDDVTDTPPVKSLKYEDCLKRLSKNEKLAIIFVIGALDNLKATNSRIAKQLAATIKLMTIMHDANGGEYLVGDNVCVYAPYLNRENNTVDMVDKHTAMPSPIYFRDKETAERAYEANKEIFHDYFGVGGENGSACY